MVVSQKALRQTPRSRHPPGSRHTPLGADPPGSRQTPRSRHLPWEQTAPRGADTPPEQTPPGADTPLGADTPPEVDPPRADPPGIRSTSGRYASYWNAFLFEKNCNYLSSKLALILIIDLIAALLSETFVFRGVCSAVLLLEKPSVKKTIPQSGCFKYCAHQVQKIHVK